MSAAELSVSDASIKPPTVSTAAARRTVLNVQGICCASEVPVIEKALGVLPGVQQVSVNVIGKKATVQHDAALTPPQTLADALTRCGMRTTVVSAEFMAAPVGVRARLAATLPRWKAMHLIDVV